MALILDATVAGTSSNAYATYASVTEILLMDIHKKDNWSSLSTSDAEASIIMATSLLDTQIDWVGTKDSEEQALRWPRDGVYNIDGESINDDIIPEFLRLGISFYGYFLSQSDRTADSDTAGFKKLKAGSLFMEVDKYDRRPTMPSIVWDILKPYGNKMNQLPRVLERI